MIDLTIEGVNTRTTDGFHLSERGPVRGASQRVVQVTRGSGGVPLKISRNPVTGVRTITASGLLRGDSQSDLATRLDRLRARADQAEEVTLAFTDIGDRVWFGEFEDLVTEDIVSLRDVLVQLRWNLVRPFAYSAVQTIAGIGTTATAVPVGSERILDLVLRVAGAATDPVVILANADGGEVGRITLDANIATGEYIDMDMANGTMIDQAGANRSAARSTDSTWPLIIDPKDGRAWAAPPQYPTLRCTSGTMTATYRIAR